MDTDSSPIEYSSIKQTPETLLSLYRISRIASEASSTIDAYRLIIEEIRSLFNPHSASISLVSPNSSLLEKEYAIGYPDNIYELSLHLGKGISGRVAFKGEPILALDVDSDSRYVELIEGVKCKMAVPMIWKGQSIGVIDVDSDTISGFDRDDVLKLQLVTNEATRVLQSIWHQKQLAVQSDQLDALIGVGQKIVSKLDIQELWDSITEAALELTGSKFCTLQLFDHKTNRINLQSTSPHSEEYFEIATSLPLEESLSAPAIRTRRQVESANITTPDYLDLLDVPRSSEVTSCLTTPMIFEDEVIGIINIYTRYRHRFPNNEKKLLQAFGSLSAISLQNANLYARVFNSEERLRKSERLTTLGLLAAEIAHEIRNPLTVIKLLFGSLGLDYPESDPRHKDKQVIKEKINHLEEIVNKVLSFGKAPDTLHSKWNVDELLSDTLLLVRHKMLQQRINIEHKSGPSAIFVTANKGQLQQVFLNLIINASEAMPHGGDLIFWSEVRNVNGSNVVSVYFLDTGSGIPENIQDKIFDSFLTDKPEGTGLGLSIVKRILRSHYGDISVDRTSASGTTMRVDLPLH